MTIAKATTGMQLKEGHFYEVCEDCGDIFELTITHPDTVLHHSPDDDYPFEQTDQDILYPHMHCGMPICPKCLNQGKKGVKGVSNGHQ
ncbi:unnamed protein product [marine sediment metagenome]|uniref:Uncharacterized protein n=1 Tax=marine sediment metagenome TaxID=412755 RepID=X1QLT3_9ZZZZ